MNIDQNRCFESGTGCTGYEKIRKQLETLSTQDAILTIEGFIRENPEFAEAHNDLGVLNYQAGNKLQTLGHYEKAVRLSPVNATFRKNLASFYFIEMGWTDDAIGIYTDILKIHPFDIEVLAALGIISNAVGRPEEAKVFLSRVLELEPWNNEARQALATVDSPAMTYMDSPPLEPDDMKLPTMVSEIDEILSSLRKPSPVKDDSIEELYLKALKLADEGMLEQAISDFDRILNRDENNALVHNDLGVLFSRTGNTAKSVFHHEQAVSFAPLNATFRKNLASLYYSAANRADDAIALYSALLRECPQDVDVLEALAIISMENDRPDEALIFLNKILELDPANTDARQLAEQLRNGRGKGFFLAAG